MLYPQTRLSCGRRAALCVINIGLWLAAGAAWAKEPKAVAFGKLPKEIQALHVCAVAGDQVEVSQERYAKAVLFFVSCPPEQKGAFQKLSVYTARDDKGRGAKRVTFEVLAPDGSAATLNALPSAVPVRQFFTRPDDKQPIMHTKNDPPWVSGSWRPEDRPEICAVLAHWQVNGEKAELWLWEEAKECPSGEAPKYENKRNRKPPGLVGP